jgi:Icc-related predicted phosphoesterase
VKVQLLSDLHFDQYEDEGKAFIDSLDPSGVDVLVLAGDIIPATSLERVMAVMSRFSSKFEKVLFVPGNHEYWGTSPGAANEIFSEVDLQLGNFLWMNTRVVTLGGHRFLGGTMWFENDVFANYYRKDWPDFEEIKNFGPWVYDQNTVFKAFLARELREGDIVITHYLPSLRSVPPQFKNKPTNAFFVCDMEKVMAERKPRIWMHGHTHMSFDYQFFDTRVVCNPRGNRGQWPCSEVFVKKLILDLD